MPERANQRRGDLTSLGAVALAQVR